MYKVVNLNRRKVKSENFTQIFIINVSNYNAVALAYVKNRIYVITHIQKVCVSLS